MRWFASRASANMLMPMTMAATARTPTTENQIRRCIGSVRLALFDDHRVQEQPEPDEGCEKYKVAQADDAAREILESVDDGDAAGDVGQCRRVARQEVGDDR